MPEPDRSTRTTPGPSALAEDPAWSEQGRTFASLRFHNYRIWFFAALVANTGTWMQRVAQDWLVLRILTDDSATATGITTALQFLPALLLSPHAGLVADRVNQRRFLIVTQSAMGLVSLVLGLAVISGHAQLWHVYLAALASGAAAAYDAPARQTFVAQLVPAGSRANAMGLNAASFNAARLLGPAAAGVVIAWVGAGVVFEINAASFLFPALALVLMRADELRPVARAPRSTGQLREGLAYIRRRTDILVIIGVVTVVSTFTLNFQLTMAAMVRSAFHLESDAYGTVSSIFAIGSLSGALWAAKRRSPRVRTVVAGSFFLGLFTMVMALMPTYASFAVVTIPVGLCVLTVLTGANQAIQLSVPDEVRGRVISIYIIAQLGTTPIGAPLMGGFADAWGPRASLLAGGAAAVLVSTAALVWTRRHWHLALAYSSTRPYLRMTGPRERSAAEAGRDGGHGLEQPQQEGAAGPAHE